MDILILSKCTEKLKGDYKMTKKYSELAKDIIKNIDGKENVKNLIHCQTRLRFDLVDDSKVNTEILKQLDGVAGVINSGGQFQVVIGTNVADVYEEVVPLLDMDSNEGNQNDNGGKKKNILTSAIEFISTSFSPIIPAMSGAGMIKALLALLVVFKLVSNESQTYYIVNFMADSVFYFLPFFLASTAAQKLKANPYLAMALAGILLHPNFISLVAAGEPAQLFAMPVRLVSYGASVIPILLIVVVQSYIEKFFNRIIPNAVKIVFVPMFTIFITGIIALVAVGPLGSYVGEMIAQAFNAIRAVAPWAPAVIVGSLLPVMVMFGIHTSIGPLDVLQLTSVGYANIFGPGAMVSNIATGVAALVASRRTKDKKEKQIATSGGITALMGITEPALYGVSLPKRYPLIGSMIGGGIGGLYAGISGASRFATGSSGLPAIPLYIGEDLSNVVNILIAIVITMISTAVATYFLSFRYEKKEIESNNDKPVTPSKLEVSLVSPINGEMFDLSEVQDEAFSGGMLGKGVAFEPKNGEIYAPFDGKIIALFPTKHAIGIESNDGVQVLIHVGLNTVELNGQFFESYVEQGQGVKEGQKIMSFELESIKEAGYLIETPVVITNSTDYSEILPSIYNSKSTKDTILTIKK